MIGWFRLEEEFKLVFLWMKFILGLKVVGKLIDKFYEWNKGIKWRRLCLFLWLSIYVCDVIDEDIRDY